MTQSESEPAKNLPTTSPDAAAEARAQANAYESLWASTDIPLEGGGVVTIPPHPDFGMLDDDRMDDYNELLFQRDTLFERESDTFVPEMRMKDPDGHETGVVLPADTIRGSLRIPYRWGPNADEDNRGKLLKPSWQVRVVKAAIGEAEYKRLRDGGRSSADVWKIWTDQGQKAATRRESDSKSVGRPVDLAPVSTSDSQ